MKEAVIVASRGQVTEGMREWAVLSWYELAAFAIVRARCCASPAALVLPAPIGGACAPLDVALNDLAAKSAAHEETEPALERFTSAIHCVVTSGSSAHFGYRSRPRGGEDLPLRKMLERAAKRSAP
jgi:serine/threonine-protein kinase